MHRTSTDKEYYESGKIVIDADGIPFEAGENTKWRRATFSGDLNTLTGKDNQGIFNFGGSATNTPKSSPGWVEVKYDSLSNRTQQELVFSSPNETSEYYRQHSDGVWGEWKSRPRVLAPGWNRRRFNGTSLDELSGATNAGVWEFTQAHVSRPFDSPGWVTVFFDGVSLRTKQLAQSSSPNIKGEWVRTHADGAWGEWETTTTPTPTPIPVPVGDRPVTYTPTLTPRPFIEIMVRLSDDRMWGLNCYSSTLRITRDNGRTWADVKNFPGAQVESTDILANGEVLVTVNRNGYREVWVSTGFDPHTLGGEWEMVKSNFKFQIKFAPGWSISHYKNIVIINEYGPKGGTSWGSVPNVSEGENARYTYLSLDYGKTWETIFDLNEYLISEGEDTLLNHLHGVAWDPYWDRIWLTFGDNHAGASSNGVLYSDDLGKTWLTARHWKDGGDTWQVTSIVPMPDAVYFGGDNMSPSGIIGLSRNKGKSAGLDESDFFYAYTHPQDKHLSQAWQRIHLKSGETVALFAMCAEGTTANSHIVAIRENGKAQLIWQDSVKQSAGMGLRSLCGPTLEGELIAGHNDLRVDANTWTELRGPVDLY